MPLLLFGLEGALAGRLAPLPGPKIGQWWAGSADLFGQAARFGGLSLAAAGLSFLLAAAAFTRWGSATPRRRAAIAAACSRATRWPWPAPSADGAGRSEGRHRPPDFRLPPRGKERHAGREASGARQQGAVETADPALTLQSFKVTIPQMVGAANPRDPLPMDHSSSLFRALPLWRRACIVATGIFRLAPTLWPAALTLPAVLLTERLFAPLYGWGSVSIANCETPGFFLTIFGGLLVMLGGAGAVARSLCSSEALASAPLGRLAILWLLSAPLSCAIMLAQATPQEFAREQMAELSESLRHDGAARPGSDSDFAAATRLSMAALEAGAPIPDRFGKPAYGGLTHKELHLREAIAFSSVGAPWLCMLLLLLSTNMLAMAKDALALPKRLSPLASSWASALRQSPSRARKAARALPRLARSAQASACSIPSKLLSAGSWLRRMVWPRLAGAVIQKGIDSSPKGLSDIERGLLDGSVPEGAPGPSGPMRL